MPQRRHWYNDALKYATRMRSSSSSDPPRTMAGTRRSEYRSAPCASLSVSAAPKSSKSRSSVPSSTASHAGHASPVTSLVCLLDGLNLSDAASLGSGYRVGASRPATNAPRTSSALSSLSPSDSDAEDGDTEYWTPWECLSNSASPPASSASASSSKSRPALPLFNLEESISCAARLANARARRSQPGAQSAPPQLDRSVAPLCQGTNKDGKPCGNRTRRGPFCHVHRNGAPMMPVSPARPAVPRTPNVFLKRWELGWLQPDTWNKLAALLNEPPSPTDTPGVVYMAVVMDMDVPRDEVHVKVGYSKRTAEARLREWNACCPSLRLTHLKSHETPRPMRLEKFIQDVLQDLVDHQAYCSLDFPKISLPVPRLTNAETKPKARLCTDCNKLHVEVFRFGNIVTSEKAMELLPLWNFISALCENVNEYLKQYCVSESDAE